MSSRANHKQPPTSYYRVVDRITHSMITRARTNSLNPKTFTTTAISSTPDIEPKYFAQAVKYSYWQQAMKLEHDAFMRNKIWSLFLCPTNVNLVGCKWIFRIMICSNGKIKRHKARLVAQGFSQEADVDYFDTFTPVIKQTTIRFVLSIVISNGWCIRQLDINNMFLHGDLKEEVYIKQPKGFKDPSYPTHVYRLHKFLTA